MTVWWTESPHAGAAIPWHRDAGTGNGADRCHIFNVDFYLDGRLSLDEMISARLTLDQVNGAFDRMRNGEVARQVIVFG